MIEKILIVEDESDVTRLLARHLKAAGFAVAQNGRVALNLIRFKQPTLLVFNLMPPELSGPYPCRILKSDSWLNQIPIVMLSAKADEIEPRQSRHEVRAADRLIVCTATEL